jgi:hypothetical protein
MVDIGSLTSLKEGWNDEGAPPIDRSSILWARNFVQQLASIAVKQNLTGECAPAVFPTIEGGVKLFWNSKEHQVALVFHPGESAVEVIEKSPRHAASHRALTADEAGDIAIRAMCELVSDFNLVPEESIQESADRHNMHLAQRMEEPIEYVDTDIPIVYGGPIW